MDITTVIWWFVLLCHCVALGWGVNYVSCVYACVRRAVDFISRSG